MTSGEEASTFEQKLRDIKAKIVYYENQKHLATQEMSIVRQKLEDIDHFFGNFGYENEFNCVTQMVANERVAKEVRFDKIALDIQHFNDKLVDLNDQIHLLNVKEFLK